LAFHVSENQYEHLERYPTMATPQRFPAPDFSAIGPQVGTHFPDVILPDQHGGPVDLHAVRGERRALIIFHRSARW
jgi:hypothetical protein